jgi:hypothetical protein
MKGFSIAMILFFGTMGIASFVAGFWHPHQFGITAICLFMVVAGFSDLKK